jgi:transposase
MKITRSLKIRLYGNPGKMEDVRYTMHRFTQYLQDWINRVYLCYGQKFSTAGRGDTSNAALYMAHEIVSRHWKAINATGNKSTVPEIRNRSCKAKIEVAKGTSFDFWISVSSQWHNNRVRVPARSHRRLNEWLDKGWKMSSNCKVIEKDGFYYAIVYVQSQAREKVKQEKFVGCDVGIRHGVSRSDGYLGMNLGHIIKRFRLKNAERRRQSHLTKSKKTALRQQLDIEVKRAIARCIATSSSLAVESPKRLANLSSGKLQGWARSYFANRAEQVAQESGVYVKEINPFQSSMTCATCGHCDKESRDKLTFKCVACGNRTHADINAARVLAQRATA